LLGSSASDGTEPVEKTGRAGWTGRSGTRGRATRLSFSGPVEVPDGVWLDLSLSYRGVTLFQRTIRARGEPLEQEFLLPGPARAPAGIYRVVLRAHPARQHPVVARALASRWPEGFRRDLEIAVGTPSEVRADLEATREWLAAALEASREARRRLDEARRGFDRAPGAGEGAGLSGWTDFLHRWMEALRPAIADRLARERESYVVAPRPEASRAVFDLVATLVDLGKSVSIALHRARGLPVPSAHAMPAIEGEGDERALRERASREERVIEKTLEEIDSLLEGR
jgi:hypothetical protein